jgi:hypothetical protein
MSETAFPADFEDLSAWTDYALATMDARRLRRVNASLPELQAFYQGVLPRLDAIVDHLAAVPMSKDMDSQSAALMNLALMMAEVAPAVEQFFEPTISNGYDTTRFAQGPQ